MISIPNILNYKPFYIQTDKDGLARNTIEWGLVAKTNPYPLLPVPKEPYKNEWFDENGHDEYNEKMYYEPIEFSVSFYIKAYDSSNETAEVSIRKSIDEFFALIGQGEFRIFDSYNGIGRRKVRYAGFEEEEFKRKDDWARAIFSVKFKVNDPVTRMVLRSGSIKEE